MQLDLTDTDFIKRDAIEENKVKIVPVLFKTFYNKIENEWWITKNWYHGQGDYETKYEEGTELKLWKDATTHAIFTAKKTGDIIDQIIADILAWPIINLNWSQKYTQAERREAYTMVVGTTYKELNRKRQLIKKGWNPPPVIWSLFHDELKDTIPKWNMFIQPWITAMETRPIEIVTHRTLVNPYKVVNLFARTKTQQGKRNNTN